MKQMIKTVSFILLNIALKLIIFCQVTLHAIYFILAERIRKLCTGKANVKLLERSLCHSLLNENNFVRSVTYF